MLAQTKEKDEVVGRKRAETVCEKLRQTLLAVTEERDNVHALLERQLSDPPPSLRLMKEWQSEAQTELAMIGL